MKTILWIYHISVVLSCIIWYSSHLEFWHHIWYSVLIDNRNTLGQRLNDQHVVDGIFKYIFSNENTLNCDWNFIEVGSQWFDWQQVGIGLGNGLVPNRWQAIARTTYHPVQRHIYVLLGLNGIIKTHCWWLEAVDIQMNIKWYTHYKRYLIFYVIPEGQLHNKHYLLMTPHGAQVMVCSLAAPCQILNQCWIWFLYIISLKTPDITC